MTFLVARYFARANVERQAERFPGFAAIDRTIGEHGWKIIAMPRLSPASSARTDAACQEDVRHADAMAAMNYMNGFRTPRALWIDMNQTTSFGILMGALSAIVGCATPPHRTDVGVRIGHVYFLDGAGGGGLLTNSGQSVEAGLRRGGYAGQFEYFRWQTGLGVLADQVSGVRFKRSKGQDLANKLSKFIASYPNTPVHLIGLSAGTAVAVFALEELPESQRVENVVMLGSSLSNHYDLSASIHRIRGRLYVFTSRGDAVLSVGVPLVGTADREYCGACSLGLHGFHLPPHATVETRKLYGKVENIEWRATFANTGNLGGHTDTGKSEFVAAHIAPLLTGRGPRFHYVAGTDQPALPPVQTAR